MPRVRSVSSTRGRSDVRQCVAGQDGQRGSAGGRFDQAPVDPECVGGGVCGVWTLTCHIAKSGLR